MSSFKLSKYAEQVSICYNQCKDKYNSLEISLNNFSRKLKKSLEDTFGEKVYNSDDDTFQSYLKRIHTYDLYLAMGMSTGNENAWEIFEDRFVPKINDFARYYADDEDIAEEVFAYTKSSLFVKIKKTGKPKIDSFNGRGSLESWLKVIVYREVIHHQKNRVKTTSLDNIVLGIEEDHETDVEMETISKIMTTGFQSINSKDKILLREYFILKKPERELAEKYHVHISTISRRLHKICDKLSNILIDLAQTEFDLGERDIKNMFREFSKSWHSNVSEILA
ncbi:MAG: hypothetical protein CMG69_02670 [Candidatus Marinimicrobia bacterium]|nr:hypothetical protein [Candidatus Neomarinimicrobiota bacterium]|tara:strand:+ start:406 stop:1245 length:840 start_codon:yes stop_codon:yes gene_type:complete